MRKRFVVAVLVCFAAVGALIFSAVKATAKPVVTVEELLKGSSRSSLRLGARLMQPAKHENKEVQFVVTDPGNLSVEKSAEYSKSDTPLVAAPKDPGLALAVTYVGVMPDTLRVGRDVIMEGDYDSGTKKFTASQLQTQCPSKYEPPVPGGNQK